MDVSLFSSRYAVRKLTEADADAVLALCRTNTQYYRYCPPPVTRESILEDMAALPPRKTLADKYYIGYFDGGRLVAVMDFIRAYPDERTDFIGFFMTDGSVQGRGAGSAVIAELCGYLKRTGRERIRLGRVEGNPQPERFWHKNGFTETGLSYRTDAYTVLVMERVL